MQYRMITAKIWNKWFKIYGRHQISSGSGKKLIGKIIVCQALHTHHPTWKATSVKINMNILSSYCKGPSLSNYDCFHLKRIWEQLQILKNHVWMCYKLFHRKKTATGRFFVTS
jgi:hypothetical protein